MNQELPSWIAFDAVGTLITPTPSVAEIYWQIGRRFGSRYSLADVQKRFARAFSQPSTDDELQTDEDREFAYWQRVMREVLDDIHSSIDCYRDLYDAFAEPQCWRVYDDVAPTLEALADRGVKLAVASNFDHRLLTLCEQIPALQPISVRVVSSIIGWKKPSSQFYRELANACGVAPADILMVGDTWETDVVPAREAGFQAKLIDRNASSPIPDHLRRLTELLPEGTIGHHS
ncbi:HAD-IA family hydrolase [Thalassoroseus pseudoceratinae]|uniref:HAD-IA family hydrolase n=1 Tax=Thalassoroseus pseudoceratinae TaxID=2713176 RepID=UPI00141DBDAE|nr:HAD-IA family hydrolase [Thalassoroseus pseudoceratinae]